MARKKDNRTDPDVFKVWEAWRTRQKRPESCQFTTDRADLIRDRLDLGYSAESLCVLIRYAFEAETDEARWWRGHNERKTKYLDLRNLTWREKLGGRVQRALDWEATEQDREAGAEVLADHRVEPGVRSGRVSRFRRALRVQD